jgi:hypothetical protein
MDYTNDPLSNQHPNQHDYDQLLAMYGAAKGGGEKGKPPARARRLSRLETISASGVRASALTERAGLTCSSWTWVAAENCSRTLLGRTKSPNHQAKTKGPPTSGGPFFVGW